MRSIQFIFMLAAFLPLQISSAGFFSGITNLEKSDAELLRLYSYQAEFNEAHKLADDLISKDDPVGYNAKGNLYRFGRGIEKDLVKAIDFYNKAIAKEYAPSFANLGEMYIRQEGGPKDKGHGMALIQRGVEMQDPYCEVVLGRLYEKGEMVQKDYTKALFYYRAAAAKDHPAAYWALARMYHFGYGVTKEERMADSYANKAAKHKYPDAAVWLAGRYLREDSRRRAYDLLEAPVKLGIPKAEGMMGWLLLYGGKKVNTRPAEGLRLLRTAADKGEAGAMFDLGKAYEDGKGISRSRYLAADWYNKAAYAYVKEDDNREGAIRALERLEKTDPNYSTLGELRAKLGVGGGAESNLGSAQEEHTAGTGWVIEPGYIVTNNHVVEGSTSIKVAFDDGSSYLAKVKSADKNNDIVILEVIGAPKLPAAIPLARSGMNAGSRVFTIGFPMALFMGSEPKVTDGIVSSTRGYLDDPRLYQISVPVQSGNSGSPLLNMKGEAVGVVTSKLAAVKVFKWTGDLPQNVNYAVKSDYVSILTKSLKRTGNMEKLGSQEASLEVVAERVRRSIVQIITK